MMTVAGFLALGIWSPLSAADIVTSGPLSLTTPGSVNTAPRVIATAWGDLSAVWESHDPDGVRIEFAAGSLSQWDKPVAISRPGALNSRYPAITQDSTGAIHAVWCEDNGTTSGVVIRSRTNGEWGDARLIRERRYYHCEYPDIAAGLDNGEGLAVVWQERFGSLSAVMGATRLPGLPEYLVAPLPGQSGDGELQLYPRLLPTPRDGTAYWYEVAETQMNLHAAELDLTRGVWYEVDPRLAPCAPLERLPLLFPPPTLALGALWVEESPLQDQIRLEVRETCEGLVIPNSEGEMLQDIYPSIATSPPDMVTLVWRATSDAGARLNIAALNTEAMTLEVAAFPPSLPQHSPGSHQPSVAVDGFGIMHVVWISDPAAGGDGGVRYGYGFWAGEIFNF